MELFTYVFPTPRGNTWEISWGFGAVCILGCKKCVPCLLQGRRGDSVKNSRTRVEGLGSIMLRNSPGFTSFSGGGRATSPKLLSDKSHISAKKSDIQEGKRECFSYSFQGLKGHETQHLIVNCKLCQLTQGRVVKAHWGCTQVTLKILCVEDSVEFRRSWTSEHFFYSIRWHRILQIQLFEGPSLTLRSILWYAGNDKVTWLMPCDLSHGQGLQFC